MWVAERHYRLLDTPMLIRFTDEELVEPLDRLLQAFATDPAPVRARHQLALVPGERRDDRFAGRTLAYRDCARIAGTDTPGEAVSRMMAVMNRMAIEACTPFAVHAGVVAAGDEVIALPVDSMGGKSTLTAALLQQGLGYVSDEALCIDPESAEVIPYPKPLALSPWSLEVLDIGGDVLPFPDGGSERLVPPDFLGKGVAQGPLKLRHVILSEFGHSQPYLEEVASSEGMAALLKYSFNHYRHGEVAFHLAARLANDTTTWRLRYDNPVEAATLIAGILL